jgi:protein-histidine pros-kinase
VDPVKDKIKEKHQDGYTLGQDTRIEEAQARTNEGNTRTEKAELRTQQAEARSDEISASELSYRRLFEAARDGILILDVQTGRITDVNPYLIELLGFARSEMIGRTVGELSPFKDIESNQAMLEQLQRHEYVRYDNLPLETKDGRHIAVEFVSNVYPAGDRNVIQCNIRDITKRKRTEDQLNASFKEISDLKSALDEHAIVAITDPQGKITYVNDKFCAIARYSREELLGQDHRIINSGHHSKQFIRDLWTTITHGKVWKGEIKNKAKDGSFYWVDTTIVPFLNEQGKPRHYVAIRADITAHKQADEQVRQLNADLEQRVRERTEELAVAKERAELANLFKSDFLANMSHELRTPLNGIIGFSEFLIDEKPGNLNPKQKEYLNDVLTNGRHLLQLINDVLDLSKVEAGKMELFPEAFSVRQAIEEVCAVLVPMAHKKKISIQRDVHPAVDAVTLDQQKFKQMLFNLLSNAVKFSSEGGSVDIFVNPCDPDRLRLQVRDTGIGIRPEDFEKLFVEFQQLDSGAARRYQGTGLGLALTKKIVQLQKGSIRVESELNKGSTFTVILPRITDQLDA